MSISNQIKFLELDLTFSHRFSQCYFNINHYASEIFSTDYCYSFSYQKEQDKIFIEKDFVYHYVDEIMNIIKLYHVLDDINSFILTHGKDPFGLNCFDRYIETVLNHPKLST